MTFKFSTYLVAAAFAATLSSQAGAQEERAVRPLPPLAPAAIAAAVPTAHEALPQLQPLVNEQTFRQLGFASPEEVKKAQVGAPLHIYMVRLDKLKEYADKEKPDTLLSETNEVLFPVVVDGQVRTGMKLRMVDGAWRFSSFGASETTRALGAASKRAMSEAKVAEDKQLAVNVPALHLHFIGYRDARGNLMLVPASDDERFKFKAGQSLPAQRVFAELAPYAKRYPTGQRLVD
jgi:hypothetical protein